MAEQPAPPRVGRGRARGRAKPPSQGIPQAPSTSATTSGPPPMAGLPKPVVHPTSSGRASHRGSGRQIDESVSGITTKVGQLSMSGSSSEGNGKGGGNGTPVGRGNMRGGRQIVLQDTIRTRPQQLSCKIGITGQPIILKANYFSLESRPDWRLNQYRVDFSPDIANNQEKFKLMREHKAKVFGDYLYYGEVLYTAYNLKDNMELYSQRDTDGTQVTITVKRVAEVTEGDAHYIQVFNILTRNCLRNLNLKLIKRDYFDPEARVQVPEYCLELWPGYKTTIKQHEYKVLMCAEITHKVLRTDTCLHLLNDTLKKDNRNFKPEFMKAVVGTVVLTEYNNSTYTIADVNWDESPRSQFERNGTKVTFIQYYKERYNIAIRDNNQPLLVSKATFRQKRAREQQAGRQPEGSADINLILLIPELCKLTGLTDEMRSDFNLMREMASHTRIAPGDRIDRLTAFNRRLNSEEKVKKELQSWQMRLSETLVDIPARVLPHEIIVLGNKIQKPSGNECDWTRHLRSQPMFVMPEGGLRRWTVMYPGRLGRDVDSFIHTLRQAAKGMSFQIAEPQYYDMNDDRTSTYVERLDYIISTMQPQLVLVVLMGNRADRYSAIKKKSLVDRAVPTQVFVAKNLNKKGVMSIATKVAIQMNCKVGGAPWSVQMPLGGLMVVGYDVCHDPHSKGKSFGAMVASLNKPMSRYFSAVTHHTHGEELSNDLPMNIINALLRYKHFNNTYPSHIMIYRDGVGDGNFSIVKNHEVESIVAQVTKLYGHPPKLGFVIVSKKINTRLFFNRNNPPPGTVVDDVVTQPERYDFFIVSQFVNQGTVSPTSYNCIYDTTGLDPDKLQRLTFKLTHCYYNWSGTVRVPAPVQYAHKLAFLTSQALHRSAQTCLNELLYFL